MKRKFISVLLILVLACSLSLVTAVPAAAQGATLEVEARDLPSITFDGAVTTEEWGDPDFIIASSDTGHLWEGEDVDNAPGDVSYDVYIESDDTNLYVAFKYTSGDWEAVKEHWGYPEGPVPANLYIDANNNDVLDGDDHAISSTWFFETADGGWANPVDLDETSVEAGRSWENKVVEYKIPMNLLGINPGDTIAFAYQVFGYGWYPEGSECTFDPFEEHPEAYAEFTLQPFVTIQGAIDAASDDDTITVGAGIYDEETVTISEGKDNLTLLGEDRDTTVIANGIKFVLASDLTGLTISNFTVQGNAGTYNTVTVGHTGTGYLRDVEFTNNLFDGQDTIGMCFYVNPIADTFSLIDNEIRGYTDFGTIYVGQGTLDAGHDGPSLSIVTFEGNNIHDNKGSSVVYGNAEDFTDQFIIRDNEFVNNGGHEWFWAAIEIDNVANLLVEDNLFEGSPVGMGEVHGAGLYLTNDNDGLFSGSVTGNQFVDNWQGLYVFSGDVGGLHVHFNNFVGNDTGIEIGPCPAGSESGATVLGTLDAKNNWWGHASGPADAARFTESGYEAYGDAVSGNVEYEPWLLEKDSTTYYEKTLALKDGWTLISPDKAVAEAIWVGTKPLVGETTVSALKYTYLIVEDVLTAGFGDATLDDLEPLTSIYVLTDGGGGVGFNYAEGEAPTVYSKELEAGWNLISSPSTAFAGGILSPVAKVTIGAQQGVGLSTLVSLGDYNQFSGSFHLATLTDADWGVLNTTLLNPFDGYWAYMNAAKSFEVPVP